MQLARILAIAIVAAGCTADPPANPTWTDDVRAILIANCVKCHSQPARYGAPATFRLDVYEDTFSDRGDVILGAGAMAPFIHERTHEETMPPTIPLTERQIGTLENWFATTADFELPARGEPVAGNRPPTMTLARRLDNSVVGDELVIDYEIADEDFDFTVGSLVVTPDGGTPVIITRELRSGRNHTVWDIGAFAEGSYTVTATLDDGNGPSEITLDSYTVTHPSGNTAPAVTLVQPRAGSILTDAQGPFPVTFDIADPDALEAIVYSLDAVAGADVVNIADGAPAVVGTNVVNFDASTLRESPNWRLRLTVSDGTATREVLSDSFVVSHQTTTSTFADANAVFSQHCSKCHPNLSLTLTLGVDLTSFTGAQPSLGRVYRRAVLERSMPPKSASLLFPDDPEITDAQRETLANWLLGGAPEN